MIPINVYKKRGADLCSNKQNMQSENLISSLIEQTQQIIANAESMQTHDLPVLTWREKAGSWNILECLEHLNLYGDYYLPQIAKTISKHSSGHEPVFKSGLLGKYFADSMLPKAKLNKMKTFKDKNPLDANLDKAVIDRFIQQQIQFINLLKQSQKVSLNKVRIKISISTLIRLKLGDTFLFIMNHNLRHMEQIKRIQALQNIG